MTSRLSVQPARLGFATIEDDEDDYTPYNELTPEERADIEEIEMLLDYRHTRRIPRKTRLQKWQHKVYLTMTDPSYSWLSRIVVVVTFIIIILSIVSILVESFPTFQRNDSWVQSGWFMTETVFITFFCIEYSIRLLTCENTLKFVVDPLNIVDIIAILAYMAESLTFYSGSAIAAFAVFRVLRVLRVFRVFRFGKYSTYFKVVVRALVSSVEAFLLLLFFLVIGLILFSTLIYFAEQTEECFSTINCSWWDDDEARAKAGVWYDDDTNLWFYDDESDAPYKRSPYQSVPESIWWCIVTMTTVGYGDTFPITPLGKTVASITMLVGLLLLAFPVGVLGAKFGEGFEREQKKEELAAFLEEHEQDTVQQRLKILRRKSLRIVEILDELNRKVNELMIQEQDVYESIVAERDKFSGDI